MISHKTIFELFGESSDRGTFLPIHEGGVRLYRDGTTTHIDQGTEREGVGPYAHLPIVMPLDVLFLHAHWEALHGLQRGSGSDGAEDASVDPSCGSNRPFPTDPDEAWKELVRRFEAVTEEVEAPHPNYPNNPKKKILVRLPNLKRALPKLPCPMCGGLALYPWAGRWLLCGSCGGTGEYVEPEFTPPPQMVA